MAAAVQHKSPQETALIRRAKYGDERAFAELVSRQEPDGANKILSGSLFWAESALQRVQTALDGLYGYVKYIVAEMVLKTTEDW